MKKHTTTEEMLMLGMALYADKKTMEQRVRGIFARRRTAMGALLCTLLLVSTLLFGCFTTACQPGESKAAVGAAEPAIAMTEPTAAPKSGEVTKETELFPEYTPTGADNEIVVSTVDEFLSALGSDRTIYMKEGDYLLTDAADYGQTVTSGYYSWAAVGDGYELGVYNAENLTITGHGANTVNFLTTPRYANVLSFINCKSVTVQGMTAGHTEAPGVCSGGVLHFANTAGALVTDSVLFGCGILGIDVDNCQNLIVSNCTVKECSQGALNVMRSYNVQVHDSRIKACGKGNEYPADSLMHVSQSDSVALVNSVISDNQCQSVLTSGYSRDVQMLGCSVSGNDIYASVFAAAQYAPIVAGCAFTDNASAAWYSENVEGSVGMQAASESGSALSEADLAGMQLRQMTYAGPIAPAQQASPAASADGKREVHASNMDEFLAAIASGTTVYLDEKAFDLTTASNYGSYGTGAYYWSSEFDGPGLVITGVTDFHIVGAGADKTSINALPRYANVLTFENCGNVSITGVTLGHFEEPGECAGGVLRFIGTNGVLIKGCGLYGCGILGVEADTCSDMTIEDTEIYDCSQGAVCLWSCTDVAFNNCNIHDCPEPLFQLNGCTGVTIDGKAFAG